MGGKRYKKKGGCGSCVLSPAPFDGVDITPGGSSPNMLGQPTFSTKQVGGGYGYDNGADASKYGGSYFPVSRACTSHSDGSRGGNNFIGGGKRRSTKRKGGKRKSGKRSSSTKRKGGKKWKQRGCKKIMGGMILL